MYTPRQIAENMDPNDECQFAYGIFETEAFLDESAVEHLEQYVTGTKIEEHPEDVEDPVWHIKYIKIPIEDKDNIISLIQKGMDDEWDSLIWDCDQIYVIFKDRIQTMPNASGKVPSFSQEDVSSIDLPDNITAQDLRIGIRGFQQHLKD